MSLSLWKSELIDQTHTTRGVRIRSAWLNLGEFTGKINCGHLFFEEIKQQISANHSNLTSCVFFFFD